MLSAAVSTDSRSEAVGRRAAGLGDASPAAGASSCMRPLDAPAGVHEPPPEVAHHALAAEAAEGEQALHHPLQRALRRRPAGRAAGRAARGSRGRARRRPARCRSTAGRAPRRRRRGARGWRGPACPAAPSSTTSSRARARATGSRSLGAVADEAGVGAWSCASGRRAARAADRFRRVGAALEVVAAVVDDPQQPGHRPRPARRSGRARTGSRPPATGSRPSGSTASTAGPDCSQNPVRRSGSEASTQVSLLIAPAWLEIRAVAASAATRVSPPGMTA